MFFPLPSNAFFRDAPVRSAIFPASFAFRASFRWHYSTLISVCGESDESSIHSHHLSNLICYLSFFHSFVHVFVILPEQSVTFRRIFRNPQHFLRSIRPVQRPKELFRSRISRKRFALKKQKPASCWLLLFLFWETAFSSPPQARIPLRRSKSRAKSIPRGGRTEGAAAKPRLTAHTTTESP